MKKDTLSVCILGLPKPWGVEFKYDLQQTNEENALSALIKAAMVAGLDVGKRITSSESSIYITDCEPADTGKTVYEAVFELNDGKKILGYSDQDQPVVDGEYYCCAANKDLKGSVFVAARYVTNFRFTPI
ncbi:hypothetical protein [Kosakonia oryziphila]|uniref:Uncharacterized protein n=1 Tax=Kosakonia oryziphila TaxID=1005667 RepID=A0A1C4G1B8_9ENTR|nr:hypothetical protein [Kosakonia oryziphila]SCC62039.1 hypothetical protein GA0061070_10495 [Kosakonia oryziphila]